MKRVKSKLAIALIGVAALVIVASIGAAAYWSVSQNVGSNTIASGHMSIAVDDYGTGHAATALTVSGIMPTDPPATPTEGVNKRTFEITSAANNPNTDLAFTVPTVTGEGTLKDNVKVAFCLMTGGFGQWLEPAGAVQFTEGAENTDLTYSSHAFIMSAYAAKSWSNLAGYTNLAPSAKRHLLVYYYLPADCSGDCHDSSVTFDMSFELLQHH